MRSAEPLAPWLTPEVHFCLHFHSTCTNTISIFSMLKSLRTDPGCWLWTISGMSISVMGPCSKLARIHECTVQCCTVECCTAEHIQHRRLKSDRGRTYGFWVSKLVLRYLHLQLVVVIVCASKFKRCTGRWYNSWLSSWLELAKLTVCFWMDMSIYSNRVQSSH